MVLARIRLRSLSGSLGALLTGVHASPHAASQNGKGSTAGQFLRHKTLALLQNPVRDDSPSKGLTARTAEPTRLQARLGAVDTAACPAVRSKHGADHKEACCT